MNRFVVVCLAIGAFGAGVLASRWHAPTEPPSIESGTYLSPPRAIRPFQLGDGATGFSSDDLQGRWHLVFFGFTRCPDICPTTLQLLADARAELAQSVDPDRLPTVVLVSVDTEYDTPERVADYVEFFGDGIHGVVASAEQLERFAQDLGALYQRVPLGDDDYTMDHTGAVIAINPTGQWQAVLSAPLRRTAVIDDLKLLIEGRP